MKHIRTRGKRLNVNEHTYILVQISHTFDHKFDLSPSLTKLSIISVYHSHSTGPTGLRLPHLAHPAPLGSPPARHIPRPRSPQLSLPPRHFGRGRILFVYSLRCSLPQKCDYFFFFSPLRHSGTRAILIYSIST